MSKIQLPPKKKTEVQQEENPPAKVSERKIQEIINKGGSPVQVNEPDEDKIKNFNLLVLSFVVSGLKSQAALSAFLKKIGYWKPYRKK